MMPSGAYNDNNSVSKLNEASSSTCCSSYVTTKPRLDPDTNTSRRPPGNDLVRAEEHHKNFYHICRNNSI